MGCWNTLPRAWPAFAPFQNHVCAPNAAPSPPLGSSGSASGGAASSTISQFPSPVPPLSLRLSLRPFVEAKAAGTLQRSVIGIAMESSVPVWRFSLDVLARGAAQKGAAGGDSSSNATQAGQWAPAPLMYAGAGLAAQFDVYAVCVCGGGAEERVARAPWLVVRAIYHSEKKTLLCMLLTVPPATPHFHNTNIGAQPHYRHCDGIRPQQFGAPHRPDARAATTAGAAAG